MEKISFGNRLFYSRFEKIDEPLSSILISQHLHRYHTVASPLYDGDKTDYLYIEYSSTHRELFIHLISYILTTLLPYKYHIYSGKRSSTIKVFVEVDSISIPKAEEILKQISSYLEKKMSREWSMLPDSTLPEEYNIFTLPYVFSRNRRL